MYVEHSFYHECKFKNLFPDVPERYKRNFIPFFRIHFFFKTVFHNRFSFRFAFFYLFCFNFIVLENLQQSFVHCEVKLHK